MTAHRNGLFFLFLLLSFLAVAGPVRAGVVYSSGELMALGEMWVETRVQWQFESAAHDRRMKKIGAMKCSDVKKDILFEREMIRHRNRSNILAAKRDQVQNALIIESNARVKGGKQPVSGRLEDSLGTRFGDEGHRGMVGDRDMAGGARTTEKVKDTLKDMGLYDPHNPDKSLIVLDESAATLEIKGDFELTINKDGLRPKAGTNYHQVQVDVNARNPETFVSESMRIRENDRIVRQQVGTEYVEVQDHITKAQPGLTSSGEELVRSPGNMQKMAKGTYKTLELGRVNDDTLAKIMKQNGIKGTPVEFKRKLKSLYRETGPLVTDPAEARRIRRASEDVFSAAEKATLKQAKYDIVDLRKKAASLPKNDPVRLKIEDELVDSVTKMKRTKAINDEFMSRALAKTRPALPPDPPTPRTPITPDNVEVELKKIETPPGGQARQRAAKAFGFVMNIVDIGQACQAIEDYMSGTKSLGETTIHFVDQFTMGVISSGRAIYNKGEDWWDTKKKTDYANQQNMAAFLNQWEINLLRAGVAAPEAKRLVGNAVLSGDLELLKRKARILRAQGKNINDPQLITETYHMDDYGQDLKDAAWGFGKGLVDGVSYPILAPYRTLVAYREGGELAVAEMDAYASDQTASSRSALFQKLVAAGAPPRRVLRELNYFEDGKPAGLRALFSEIRAKQEAERAEAEAEAEKARQEALALADRLGRLLPQYNAYVTYLLTAPLELTYTPAPAKLKPDLKAVLIRLSLDDPQGYYQKAAKELEKLLTEISGVRAKVYLDYKFSCPGKPGRSANVWYTNSPRTEGIYPVTGEIWVDVRGAGLSGPLSVLQRNFVREAQTQVEVTAGKADYDTDIWRELRKTKVTTIRGYGGYFSATGQVGAARSVSYDFTARGLPGRAEINLSADGKRITRLFVEYTEPTKKGSLQKRRRFTVKNMKLHTLTRETAYVPTKAYYVMDQNQLRVTIQRSTLGRNGHWSEWTKPRQEKWSGGAISVFFEMDDQTKTQKKKARREAKKAEREALQAQKDKAGTGRRFVGPIGQEDGYKGNIEVSIGPDGSVHGQFKSYKKLTFNGEKASASIRGEFLGAIDSKTGQMTTRLLKGSGAGMSCFNAKYKLWSPCGDNDRDWFADKGQVIGQLKGNVLTGHLLVGSQKLYPWTAKPAPAKEGK